MILINSLFKAIMYAGIGTYPRLYIINGNKTK